MSYKILVDKTWQIAKRFTCPNFSLKSITLKYLLTFVCTNQHMDDAVEVFSLEE